MVAALRLHWLADGELPIYRTSTSDFLWLNVNEDDPPASRWEGRGTYGEERKAIIPIVIDLSLLYFSGVLSDWILDLEDVCPGGTLIFALRYSCEIEPLGQMIMAGLGCIPEGPVDGAFDLQGTRPEELILQMCQGGGRDIDGLHPIIREMFARQIAAREERERSVIRSRKLLDFFLSPEQRAELDTTKAFHVQGQDGRIYRIRQGHAHNVDLIEDGAPKIRYCLVSKEYVPMYDLMLGQKLLLETDLDEFCRLANFRRLAHVADGEAPPSTSV